MKHGLYLPCTLLVQSGIWRLHACRGSASLASHQQWKRAFDKNISLTSIQTSCSFKAILSKPQKKISCPVPFKRVPLEINIPSRQAYYLLSLLTQFLQAFAAIAFQLFSKETTQYTNHRFHSAVSIATILLKQPSALNIKLHKTITASFKTISHVHEILRLETKGCMEESIS